MPPKAESQGAAVNTRPRIVVIGGGSQYAFGICQSLIDFSRDLLAGARVVLLDIDQQHLDLVGGFAKGLASELGSDVRFEVTTDRRRAFEGADFIINTFRPGSFSEQELDESVPPKFGLQGNETIGIGGIFMACRVAPVLEALLADAEELCSSAWILNYTNPTQYVADIVDRVSSIRVISLCDGYVEFAHNLGVLFGVDPNEIELYPAGTNHNFWVMRFTVGGRDGYPLLRERLGELSDADLQKLFEARTPVREDDGTITPASEVYEQFIENYGFGFNLRLFELYGLLHGPRYYTRYWFDQDAVIDEQRAGDYVTMAGYYIRHAAPGAFADMKQQYDKAKDQLLQDPTRRRRGHGDFAVRIISSMVNDLREQFVVNVPNEGAISNLPDDAVVEIPALVGRDGPERVALGPLPKELLGLQYSFVISQQLVVDAALSGDRDELLRAIIAHPLINSLDAAERCMDELLRLQSPWLPQFKDRNQETPAV